MNEEIKKNEISEEEMEQVSGGVVRIVPTVPVYSPEKIGVLFGKHEEE